MKHIAGVTMLELLCSLMISVIIVSGLTSIYGITQQHFKLQTALLGLTENSRIMEQLWMTVIRSAVYQGCLKMKKANITPYYASDVKPGTDAITIRYADTMGDDLLLDMKDDSVMYVTSSHRFSINDDIMISDCESVEFFKVKNVTVSTKNQKIISDKPLKKLYKKYSQVNLYQSESYYIGMIDALYRKNKNGHKMEIMEGINDMKFSFSIIQGGRVKDISAGDFDDNNDIKGVGILLKHTSLIKNRMNKTQYIYVALR